MSEDTETKRPSGGLFAGGGVATGLAALIGASCCVLPILLVQAGVSTALVAHLGIFAQAKPYLLALTAILVLAGFVAAFWGGRRPRPRVLVLLVVAAFLVVSAYSMPFYERELLDWVRGR
jgi:mercuric ion transport protein